MKLKILLIALLVVGCVHRVAMDNAMGAVEGGDKTALVGGCGNQLVPGYAYCRVREGANADMELTFVAPPAWCKDKAGCVSLRVYDGESGNPVFTHVFEPKKLIKKVKWSTLIADDKFIKGDRGFWPFQYKINFKDKKGRARTAYTEGEIRLRVYDKKYEPLNNAALDKNYVWVWNTESTEIKMTTGGRTYVEAK